MGTFYFYKEGERVKIKLLTQWKGKQLLCCCPIENKCSKDHGCEELVFTLDPYEDIEKCMKHSSYKKCKGGAFRQVTHE